MNSQLELPQMKSNALLPSQASASAVAG